MPASLKTISLSVSVISTIYDIIARTNDSKHLCLVSAISFLVYWYVSSTPETPEPRQGPTTPERRQQLAEWLHQEEFIAVIARAMEQAAQDVARGRISREQHPILDPVTPPRRRR